MVPLAYLQQRSRRRFPQRGLRHETPPISIPSDGRRGLLRHAEYSNTSIGNTGWGRGGGGGGGGHVRQMRSSVCVHLTVHAAITRIISPSAARFISLLFLFRVQSEFSLTIKTAGAIMHNTESGELFLE